MTLSTESEIVRQDWPLLLIARDVLGVSGPETLDPVRIQKGIFLLSQRGPRRDLYTFRPYNWGPYSSELNSDLDFLVVTGMLKREQEPGRTWNRFRLTPQGEERARILAASLKQEAVEWLGKTRLFLTSRSFGKLLADVYEAFPEYATASLFRP